MSVASKYIYRTYISNEYLGVSKEIKAQTKWELDLKIEEQKKKWAEQSTRRLNQEKAENLKQNAERMNFEAQAEIKKYKNILSSTLCMDNAPYWEKMLKNDPFPPFSFNTPKPIHRSIPPLPEFLKPGLFETRSKREKRLATEHEAEEAHKARITAADEEYNLAVENYEKLKKQACDKYTKEKDQFEKAQKDHNDGILLWKDQFENGDGISIEKYISIIIANFHYPDAISAENEVFYDMIAKTAVISFDLPSPEDLPQEIGYKFVATRKAIDPIPMGVRDKASFYENIIHQIALSVIHGLFKGVYIDNFLESVVFNGWVNGVNKSTGQDFNACILSVQASKEEFEKINLERVEPKECLRGLKAIYAGPLQNLAPVKPIMDLNREDKRFITSVEILDDLDCNTNLVTMQWGEFEHLVRELFSKIFTKDGGEVKVTQASRDGGVDAIAFDPDPIRGGKFVIQAKRYNNVVPVSACRDLYGTMINEGAVKGILVTTSYYGNDSRNFAKDKPITLIDGSNLIHLLSEHGYDFRINLKEQT